MTPTGRIEQRDGQHVLVQTRTFQAPVEDVWPAAERACHEHLGALQQLMDRTVQTNEVGRSAVLFGVLGMLGRPVRLLEAGASAGLNLRCDRFAYEVGDGVLGDAGSPVRLLQPWTGQLPPTHPVEVVERHGCDPSPVDPTTRCDAGWRSCRLTARARRGSRH